MLGINVPKTPKTTEQHTDSLFAAMQNIFRGFVRKLRLPVKQQQTGDNFLPEWASIDALTLCDVKKPEDFDK